MALPGMTAVVGRRPIVRVALADTGMVVGGVAVEV